MQITSDFLAKLGPSAIRSITMQIDANVQKGIDVVSFAGGKPAKELFPMEDLKKVTMEIFDQEDGQSVQYAPSSGYGPLKNVLANFMKRFAVNGVTSDQILPFAGSSQALAAMCRALLGPNDTVVCEQPSYTGALDIFRSYCHKIEGIPMDEDGMNIEVLEAVLKQQKVRFIYVIPDFQNPSGRLMSVEKRKKLVELAQKYNTVIFEDAPYSLLAFDGQVMPAIKSFDINDAVIYIGSVSKTIAPGLRVGWIVGPKEFIQKMVYVKMIDDLQVNNIAQRQVCKYMSEQGFDAHLDEIRAAYKSRSKKMIKAIQETFPSETKLIEPKGGMFMWVELPKKIDTVELFDYVFKQNIAFVPGTYFYTDGTGRNTIRLNYSTPTEAQIIQKVAEMGHLITKFTETK